MVEATNLNDLSSTTNTKTIRIMGFYGKKKLIILVENGSTHSFVASETAN